MTHIRANAHRWRALGCLIAVLSAALVAVTAAFALDLTPGLRAKVPGVEISYLSDPQGALTLDQAIDAYRAGEAQPIPGDTVDFGNVFDTYWAFVSVVNTGAETGAWHVATTWPFAPELTIDLVTDDGTVDSLLQSDIDSHFDARPVAHRTLVSKAMHLDPDEHGLLTIMFQAGGVSTLPFTLESVDSLHALLTKDAVITSLFFAFSISAILFFVLFSLALRSETGLYYSGLFALALLLNAQIDGLNFQFLWPNAPAWNGLAALALFLTVSVVGFLVAGKQRSSLTPSPRFRWTTNLLALIGAAAGLMIPFIAPGILLIVAYGLFALMIASHVYAIAPQVMQPGRRGLAAMAGAGIVAVAVALLTGLFMSDVQLPPLLVGNSHRIFYLAISLPTMFTLAGFVMHLRRDHESALEREVDAARRDAALNRELFESEKNYARARDLAAVRQRQLASASHDIKQPLASLRLSMDALVGDGDTGIRSRLKEAFDYLEGLTGTYLAEARTEPKPEIDVPEAEDYDSDGPAQEQERTEPYPLSLITATVDQMFREEAVSKGLTFHCVGSDDEITVPVLPLMRLFSNFVSNAVKYTVEGSVKVTAGRDSDGVHLQVEDTGPGMAAEALADLRQAGRKGETSHGEGLGMAIADDVARTLGLSVQMDSIPGQGTRIKVRIGDI